VEQRNASDNTDFIFPSQELVNMTADNFASKTSAVIQIPAGVIQSRGFVVVHFKNCLKIYDCSYKWFCSSR